MVSDTYSLFLDVLLLSFDGLFIFWGLSDKILKHFGYDGEHEILQSAVFIVVTSFVQTLLKIPFSVYNTFVLEEKHGFNKQVGMIFAH